MLDEKLAELRRLILEEKINSRRCYFNDFPKRTYQKCFMPDEELRIKKIIEKQIQDSAKSYLPMIKEEFPVALYKRY